MAKTAWETIEIEAAELGKGGFPLRAYSEFMPPPFVGVKPYAPTRDHAACTAGMASDDHLDITEYEVAQELAAGADRIGAHVVREIGALMSGKTHALSKTLLGGNPAWPDDLAAAAAAGKVADDPIALLLSIALSRTQDESGNVRWTLFGSSHEGASRAFWESLAREGDRAPRALAEILAWLGVDGDARVLADADVPRSIPTVDSAEKGTLVTFRPFGELPARVRAAYLARALTLVPCPASLIFFHHPRYRALAASLPYAMQIPLLHLFPRVEQSCTIRIPQSGWLDESDPATTVHVRRTHRWERVDKDDRAARAETGDGKFTDKVTVALFATDADTLGLYDKPMARNAQIWTSDYQLVLDGPAADRAAITRASEVTDRGGRFGYRFVFPAMRAGARELYWHLPLVARKTKDGSEVLPIDATQAPRGHVTAEKAGAPSIVLAPRLLARDDHRASATCYEHEPGRVRYTTSQNAKKLLDLRELLGEPLSPAFARASLRIGKQQSVAEWIAHLPDAAADRAAGARLAAALRATLSTDDDPGAPITLEHTASRAFEEGVWRQIAELAEGEYRQKENADGIGAANKGKHGGPAAKKAHLHVADRRDLDALGDHLHAKHKALIEKHGMTGKAEVVDHVFAWETDFDYDWMHGWAKNKERPSERNVVCVIPGRDRSQAVIMGDHYDTAYMEDVYDPDRGGDGLRAPAAGADDNHSATTALLCAAEVLLAMSKRGELARDVWLVHLTGEEFPADSLGARAIAQALIEGRLAFTAEDGSLRDVSRTRVVGAYVLDMVGHNNDKHRDVFQISPGEGAASARLAWRAHRANERWNRLASSRNQSERPGLARAQRMPDGKSPPPPFAHLALAGEVRVEWEPKSSLYNTDGQVFSDMGIPVVLFMENYDIDRTGYHDTLDNMANIDLDYCAALIAIAIESVADAASAVDER